MFPAMLSIPFYSRAFYSVLLHVLLHVLFCTITCTITCAFRPVLLRVIPGYSLPPRMDGHGCPFKYRLGPVRDLYGRPRGITGMPVRGPLKSRCAPGLPWDEAGHARINPVLDFYGVYWARYVRVNHGHAHMAPVRTGSGRERYLGLCGWVRVRFVLVRRVRVLITGWGRIALLPF